MSDQTELKIVEPKAVNGGMPPLERTGNQIMDMVQHAVMSNNLDMVERLLAIRDNEDARDAKAQFNAAYTKMRGEFPDIPKRGKGHNKAEFALYEDIVKYSTPVLTKHGLSMRHDCSNSDGPIVCTIILSHVSGHAETSTMKANPDKTGSKNDIQAIKSTNSYLKRMTSENTLGMAAHGEDDDAFSAGESDFDTSPFTEAIMNASSMADLNKVGDDMKSQDVPEGALKMLRMAWANKAAEIGKAAKNAA